MGAAGDALFPKRETPAPVEDRSVQMPPAQQGASVQAASHRPVNRNPMVALPSGATTQPYRPTGDSSAMFRSTEPDMQPSNPQMQGINQDMAGFAKQQPKKIDVVNQQLNQQVQEELKQLKPEAAELASQQEIMDSAYAYTLAKNSPTYAQVQEDPELGSDFQNTLKKAFGNEEMWLTLAMGFNSMRMRPDATLGAALADRLKTIRTQKQQNKTINRLMQSGDPMQRKIAELMSSGMSYKDAYKAAQGGGEPAAIQTLRIRAEEAGLKPGTPEYQKFMAEGGVKKGMGVRVRPDGTVEFVQGGDLPSLTEAQSNALVFSQRMRQSNDVLNDLESQGTSLGQSLASKIPLAGNYLLSDEYQRYDQARRNFVNAVLRKESGAAIAESEFANAEKQYFPVPGDSEAVIAQKKRNRELAMQLMERTVPGVERFAPEQPKPAVTEEKPKKRIRYDAQGNRIP